VTHISIPVSSSRTRVRPPFRGSPRARQNRGVRNHARGKGFRAPHSRRVAGAQPAMMTAGRLRGKWHRVLQAGSVQRRMCPASSLRSGCPRGAKAVARVPEQIISRGAPQCTFATLDPPPELAQIGKPHMILVDPACRQGRGAHLSSGASIGDRSSAKCSRSRHARKTTAPRRGRSRRPPSSCPRL